MKNKRDPNLQAAFRELLEEANPGFSLSPEFADEFAGSLADFADAWAAGSVYIDLEEQRLRDLATSHLASAQANELGAERIRLHSSRTIDYIMEATVEYPAKDEGEATAAEES